MFQDAKSKLALPAFPYRSRGSNATTAVEFFRVGKTARLN
jgi:hypothetical protein